MEEENIDIEEENFIINFKIAQIRNVKININAVTDHNNTRPLTEFSSEPYERPCPIGYVVHLAK